MKRRHFIMLSKGRGDMRSYLSTLGLSATTETIVEVEKAFYLTSFDPETLHLEGAYEDALYLSAKALVETLESQDLEPSVKQREVLSHLALVNEGRYGGEADAAMKFVVNSFLDAMKTTYDGLPLPMRDEGRLVVLNELSKWEPRFSRCGMDMKDAQEHVLGCSSDGLGCETVNEKSLI